MEKSEIGLYLVRGQWLIQEHAPKMAHSFKKEVIGSGGMITWATSVRETKMPRPMSSGGQWSTDSLDVLFLIDSPLGSRVPELAVTE